MMFFIVLLPMTLASLDGTNLPSPLTSIQLAALMRNLQISAAFPVLHLIPSTSVESLSLVGPVPIEVLKISKGGQLIITLSLESVIVLTMLLREGSSLRALSGLRMTVSRVWQNFSLVLIQLMAWGWIPVKYPTVLVLLMPRMSASRNTFLLCSHWRRLLGWVLCLRWLSVLLLFMMHPSRTFSQGAVLVFSQLQLKYCLNCVSMHGKVSDLIKRVYCFHQGR